MTQTMSTAPATDKQVTFILELLERHTGYSDDFGARLPKALAAGAITKTKASEIIDWLTRRPYAEKTPAVKIASDGPIGEGFWITDPMSGEADSIDVWKVQQNLKKTGIYGKKLIVTEKYDGTKSGRFSYVKGSLGMMSKLNPRPMTIEEAKKYGSLYGVCSRCGRGLTHEDSIERMLGPVCYGYLMSKGHSL